MDYASLAVFDYLHNVKIGEMTQEMKKLYSEGPGGQFFIARSLAILAKQTCTCMLSKTARIIGDSQSKQ